MLKAPNTHTTNTHTSLVTGWSKSEWMWSTHKVHSYYTKLQFGIVPIFETCIIVIIFFVGVFC